MHRSWFSRLFGGSTRDEAFAPVPATEARKAEAGGFDSAESLRACLDCLPGNVFFADPAFRLTYMNDAARHTVQAVEPEIRRVFGVSAADILNGSIHRFHRDPARVEAILQNYVQTLPREATFSFGSVTLRTAINAVLTPDRRLLGYIVNWEDVSRLRSMEAEVEERRERAR
ncbi:MAG TPA: PAS domain-containing protein [Plasticicumulans sp.]|nr:PAS domain-containing protein [Plasticicumulans sp.]